MTILFVFMTIMIVNIYGMLVILICQILQKKELPFLNWTETLKIHPLK